MTLVLPLPTKKPSKMPHSYALNKSPLETIVVMIKRNRKVDLLVLTL